MSSVYRHTQPGWVIVASTVPVGLLVLGIAVASGQPVMLGWISFVILAVAVLFGALTVQVSNGELVAKFGPGLIRRRVRLADVRAATTVTNPWYYGWGLRLYPGGTLYNVSGSEAVELQLRDGSQCRIGTDEPDALLRAVLAATGPLPPLSTDERAAQRARASKWGIAIVVSTLAIVGAVAALVVVQRRPPVVHVDTRAIAVDVPFYGVAVPLDQVRAVTLEERIPRVLARTNGFAMGETLRGWFRVDGLGDGKLFVEAAHPPFVLVRHDGGYLIVNSRDAAETRAMFERLKGATAER